MSHLFLVTLLLSPVAAPDDKKGPSVTQIREVLKSPDKSRPSKVKALEALRKIEKPQVQESDFEVVAAFIQGNDRDLKMAAIDALQIFDQKGTQLLFRLAVSQDNDACERACYVLPRMKEQSVQISEFLTKLISSAVRIRVHQVGSADPQRSRTRRYIAALKELDGDGLAVVKACPEWINAYTASRNGRATCSVIDEATRCSFHYILKAEGKAKDTTPSLIGILQIPEGNKHNYHDVENAVKCLGAIGPEAKDALPVLRSQIRSSYSSISEAAEKSIALINQK